MIIYIFFRASVLSRFRDDFLLIGFQRFTNRFPVKIYIAQETSGHMDVIGSGCKCDIGMVSITDGVYAEKDKISLTGGC